MPEAADSQIERTLREKTATGWSSPITGLKLLIFGVQLTLIGGIVGWDGFILIGGAVGLVGLFVP